ncbi:AAA family ATPase [Hydrogenophaga sp. OTU3427]|uniref:AAA family ATPase n=1 Tax=Hydrogenophaga sp. OTU3427 TaxID=3043856 RepID=UPI00313B5115
MTSLVFEEKSVSNPPRQPNTFYFYPNNWDDFGFKTTFYVFYVDKAGTEFKIGQTRVGYRGQVDGWTLNHVKEQASPDIFSLGQDVSYYKSLQDQVDPSVVSVYFKLVGDIAAHDEIFQAVQGEAVLAKSLMRDVSISAILGQYRRVIDGKSVLTPFRFRYKDPGEAERAAFKLDFKVEPMTTPSTNLHVLIGRNGVGKTTILNNMVRSIIAPHTNQENRPMVLTVSEHFIETPSDASEFSCVVSVSFSAFDPFEPPPSPDQDRSAGVAYFYVGMQDIVKDVNEKGETVEVRKVKTRMQLRQEFVEAVHSCISLDSKRDRWSDAIGRIESDRNFQDIALRDLMKLKETELKIAAGTLFDELSSGHAVVLLTITKLVDCMEEKTLVLLDEPESHLHPPLLSSFIRALSDLLNHRNAVAVIATHSPVVLQEVPRGCVWVISRVRSAGSYERPSGETFGENVGVLTRAVFGLEVAKSGFHDNLQQAVDKGGSFESICLEFGEQLGFEAQAQLRAMIRERANRGGEQ